MATEPSDETLKDIIEGDRKPRQYHFSLPWEAGVGLDLYLQKMQIRKGDFIREAVYEKLERCGEILR